MKTLKDSDLWSMYFLFIYEYETLKPVEFILIMVRENYGGDESNQHTLYVKMEMLQHKPLHNYNI
jgi:hypothetical protein